MARGSKMVVQGVRLRDQVYDVIREELKTGGLKPGQRLFENQLATKYGVSRTPVREALFQLAREGLLIGADRSFSLPIDTIEDLRDRIEVHILLDPAVSRHAASEGTEEQMKALGRAYSAEHRADQAGRFAAFAEANYQLRKLLRDMCRNVALVRCAATLEDQFLFARNELFRRADNRAIAVHHDGRIVKAVQARDTDQAAQMSLEYAQALAARFKDASIYDRHQPAAPPPDAPPARRGRNAAAG
ncbi:MAG: GntR family transcriptional regulator [Caulobacteraceae bacterium]